MPPASEREYHIKWCPHKNRTAERLHMVLSEAGEKVTLYRKPVHACGHEHLVCTIEFGEPLPTDEVILRGRQLAFPPEMLEDFLGLGIGMTKPVMRTGERVR